MIRDTIFCPHCKGEIDLEHEVVSAELTTKVYKGKPAVSIRAPRKGDTVYVKNDADVEWKAYVDKVTVRKVKDKRVGKENKMRDKYILNIFTEDCDVIPPVYIIETFGGANYAKMRRPSQ